MTDHTPSPTIDEREWPTTTEGWEAHGRELGYEIQEILNRWVQQRLMPTAQKLAAIGADPDPWFAAIADCMRDAADTLDPPDGGVEGPAAT